MIRGYAVLLGIGLIVLWFAGLANNAEPWLTWLAGLAALLSFAIAASAGHAAGTAARGRLGGPLGLSLALFTLWIIALATRAQSWLAWWTFAFACAYFILGVSATERRIPPTEEKPPEKKEEQPPYRRAG